MCKISTETEFEIQELINAKRKGKVSPLTEEIHDHLEEEICDENLIAEFETVLISQCYFKYKMIAVIIRFICRLYNLIYIKQQLSRTKRMFK